MKVDCKDTVTTTKIHLFYSPLEHYHNNKYHFQYWLWDKSRISQYLSQLHTLKQDENSAKLNNKIAINIAKCDGANYYAKQALTLQ